MFLVLVMDHSKKQILEKYRISIERDLEIDYLLDKLFESTIISYNEKQRIDKEVSLIH